MAIIVEEEKKSSGILMILGWIVIIGIVIAAVYYVFFVIPPSAIILPSGNLQTINAVAPSNLDPQGVIGSSEFQALKQYIASPVATGPAGIGRNNPFLAP